MASFPMPTEPVNPPEDETSSSGSTMEMEKEREMSQGGSEMSLEPSKELDPVALKKANQMRARIEQEKFYGIDKIVVPKYSKPKGIWYKFRFVFADVYRRIFAVAIVANAIALSFVVRQTDLQQATTNCITAAAANLLATGAARWPIVSNSFYYLVNATPHWMPLWYRRRIGKVYHFGGIHSGTGASALMWYIAFVVLLTQVSLPLPGNGMNGYVIGILVMAYMMLLQLLAIIIAAIPYLRVKQHDSFEFTHRYMGWFAIILLWPQMFLYAYIQAHGREGSLGDSLWRLPGFWIALVLTCITVHPWILLGKVPVNAERLSDHAVRLHFAHREIGFAQGIEISHNPLKDWHSFAAFQDPNGYSFSLIVSKAGDFTTDLINNPPKRLWKKGVPKFGVVKGMQVFKSFVIVATGSGIGPCLSFLGTELPPHRVIWQSRGPLKTYGDGMIDIVKQLDPDPIIIDTDKTGRQDIIPYILMAKKEINAEAVVIISNPGFTAETVYRLESIGVPAYGPIFDS